MNCVCVRVRARARVQMMDEKAIVIQWFGVLSGWFADNRASATATPLELEKVTRASAATFQR